MSTYFTGRRERDPVKLPFDGGTMTCRIFEYWEDTDNTTTARCGDPGFIEVKRVVGISERDETVLKTHIESMIGVKGFAELKSKIEASVSRAVNFSVEQSTTKTSNFSSPDCGRKTMFVYQLVRDYEFFYSKKFLRWTKTWERTIRERTNVHDFLPDIEELDEICKCDDPIPPANYDGMLVIDMDRISVRAPFRRTSDGIESRVDAELWLIKAADLNNGFSLDISVARLPEMVRLLGEFESDTVPAEFSEYRAPENIPEVPRMVDEGVEALEADEISIDILQDQSGFQEGEL